MQEVFSRTSREQLYEQSEQLYEQSEQLQLRDALFI
jgi:hypothetical protein